MMMMMLTVMIKQPFLSLQEARTPTGQESVEEDKATEQTATEAEQAKEPHRR